MDSFVASTHKLLANQQSIQEEELRDVENEGGQADSLSVHALAGGDGPGRRK